MVPCAITGVVPLHRAYPDRDILQEVLDAARARGIRVHAWFTSTNDAHDKTLYPEKELMHFTGERKTSIIDLKDADYRAYMAALAAEMCREYDVDGIHLDSIRYNHLMNGWDVSDLQELTARGADTEHLQDLMRQTFTAECPDSNAIFRAYREGDRDTIILAEYRCDHVVRFAHELIGAARGNSSRSDGDGRHDA